MIFFWITQVCPGAFSMCPCERTCILLLCMMYICTWYIWFMILLSFISLQIFCLIVLSITGSGFWKFQQLLLNCLFLTLLLPVFFFYNIIRGIVVRWIYVYNRYIFLMNLPFVIMWYLFLSHLTIFVLKYICSVVSIVTPVLFSDCLLSLNFQLFNLFVCLGLKWVTYRRHIVGSF